MPDIAFDSASNGGNNGGSGPLTFDFNNVNGDVVWVGVWRNVTDDLTVYTYGGVTMELVGKETTNGNGFKTYLFRLLAPPKGHNNVVINGATNQYILGVAVSYQNAKQTGAVDNVTPNMQHVQNLTTTHATTADRCWSICVETQSFGQTPSGGSGTTQRAVDPFAQISLYDSNGLKTPAGSVSLTVVSGFPGAGDLSMVMASFAPATAAGAQSIAGYTIASNLQVFAPFVSGGAVVLPATGTQKQFFGTPQTVLTLGSTLSTSSVIGAIYDNTIDAIAPYAPLALAVLNVTGFGGVPAPGGKVELWGLIQNDTDTPTAVGTMGGARFLGEWLMDDVNAAQRHSMVVLMEGVERMTLYLANNTGQDINSGATLKVSPLAYGVTV